MKPHMLSEAEKARITAEVSALGHELDLLASASETARVYPREVEAVRDALQLRGFFMEPAIVQGLGVPSGPRPRRRRPHTRARLG